MKFKKNLHPPEADSVFPKCLVPAFLSGGGVSNLKTIIMSKKQEELTLSELMKASGIIEGIERFRAVMGIYECSESVRHCCYNVQREFMEVESIITTLESQLEELIDQSKVWETDE
ncbi:MAG: hypothetical protein GQ574_16850 [Crocinitomix sp.]|nr:hypothetical protein [Crocinitomix sp.]